MNIVDSALLRGLGHSVNNDETNVRIHVHQLKEGQLRFRHYNRTVGGNRARCPERRNPCREIGAKLKINRAINAVATVRTLITNGWVRLIVVDPESAMINIYEDGKWVQQAMPESHYKHSSEEPTIS